MFRQVRSSTANREDKVGRAMKINSAYVVALSKAIQSLGHDPATFIQNPDELGEAEFFLLCDRVAAHVSDPSFALCFGSGLHLGMHGILGNAVMSCRTLQQAAEFLVRHNPLDTIGCKLNFAFNKENAILTLTENTELPSAPHFLPQVFLMAVVNGIRELTGRDLINCRVEFAFPPLMPETTYKEFFEIPIVFNAPRNSFIGPREATALPLASAGNEVADIFVRQCSRLLTERDETPSCASQVRHILADRNDGCISEHEVAKKLHMSSRTLRRRLSAEDTSFREIYDDMRNGMAIAYLTETRLPILEIGLMLGFDDVANFRRAFRRWNNCSPQAFRTTISGNKNGSSASEAKDERPSLPSKSPR